MHRLLTAFSILAYGCVDDAGSRSPEPAGEIASVGEIDVLEGDDEPDDPRRICELLPCDGPCSLACDYDALVAQYVPENTCVSWLCELTDGSSIVVHACN